MLKEEMSELIDQLVSGLNSRDTAVYIAFAVEFALESQDFKLKVGTVGTEQLTDFIKEL